MHKPSNVTNLIYAPSGAEVEKSLNQRLVQRLMSPLMSLGSWITWVESS